MSGNPFFADAETARRIAEINSDRGDLVRGEIARRAPNSADRLADRMGAVLAASDVAEIISTFDLEGVDDVMLLGLGVAETLSRPPISDFHVGAIGLESETGNLVLGGNIEFPSTHLGCAIHGEGFVVTRAFNRGASISRIALGEAHPCAHCRQYLSEFRTGAALQLIDVLGHRLTLGDLYPWPFDTGYLGEPGAKPGAENWPELAYASGTTPTETAAALVAAGRRAHAPYSRCPSAVVLTLSDGNRVAGSSVESVAFNPTFGPLQAAIVELLAHGYDYGDIVGAALGTVRGGNVDFSASVHELLGVIAPGAALTVLDWSV